MPSNLNPLPYTDASLVDDGASMPPMESLSSINPEPAQGKATNHQPATHPTATAPSQQQQQPTTTDPSDKIIMTSIPVRVDPSDNTGNGDLKPKPKTKSLFSLARKPKTKLKIVLLPQSEHSKYFARDKRTGAYLGTEPEREWTEEELDERYARYKSTLPPAPMKVGSALRDGGGLAASSGSWTMNS